MTGDELEALKEQVDIAVAAGITGEMSKHAALALCLSAHEMGIAPFTALRTMHLTRGKVTMSADMLLGICLRDKSNKVRIIENSATRAVIEASRDAGRTWSTFEFSMEDARRAGLGGQMYNKYPSQMLLARCKAKVARGIFPDHVANVYTPEELGSKPHQDDVPEPAEQAEELDPGQVEDLAEKFHEAIADAASREALKVIAAEMQQEFGENAPAGLSKAWHARARTCDAVDKVNEVLGEKGPINLTEFLDAVTEMSQENPGRYDKKRPSFKDIAAHVVARKESEQ